MKFLFTGRTCINKFILILDFRKCSGASPLLLFVFICGHNNSWLYQAWWSWWFLCWLLICIFHLYVAKTMLRSIKVPLVMGYILIWCMMWWCNHNLFDLPNSMLVYPIVQFWFISHPFHVPSLFWICKLWPDMYRFVLSAICVFCWRSGWYSSFLYLVKTRWWFLMHIYSHARIPMWHVWDPGCSCGLMQKSVWSLSRWPHVP